MITDIEEGEQLLTHDPAADERLLLRLGLAGRRNGTKKKQQEEGADKEPKGTSSGHRNAHIGQRNPNRDPVKGEPAAHG